VHFGADLLGTAVVAARGGEGGFDGDSIAALFVAVLRRGRSGAADPRNVDVLMDRAPADAVEARARRSTV
jgi:hypothetical protein